MHGLPFGFQPIKVPYALSLFYFSFFFFFFHSSLSFSFFFQIWLQERLRLLQPPAVPLSSYLPKHLRDRQLHQNDMGFEAYMELMGRLKETDIQWVMEWWHISSIVHSYCKDHCVTLVGFRCCSYYSTCHISRNLESIKELLMMRRPTTSQCSPTGSWVGSVRLSHVAG